MSNPHDCYQYLPEEDVLNFYLNYNGVNQGTAQIQYQQSQIPSQQQMFLGSFTPHTQAKSQFTFNFEEIPQAQFVEFKVQDYLEYPYYQQIEFEKVHPIQFSNSVDLFYSKQEQAISTNDDSLSIQIDPSSTSQNKCNQDRKIVQKSQNNSDQHLIQQQILFNTASESIDFTITNQIQSIRSNKMSGQDHDLSQIQQRGHNMQSQLQNGITKPSSSDQISQLALQNQAREFQLGEEKTETFCEPESCQFIKTKRSSKNLEESKNKITCPLNLTYKQAVDNSVCASTAISDKRKERVRRHGNTVFLGTNCELRTSQRTDVALKNLLRTIRRYYLTSFNQLTGFINLKRQKSGAYFAKCLRAYSQLIFKEAPASGKYKSKVLQVKISDGCAIEEIHIVLGVIFYKSDLLKLIPSNNTQLRNFANLIHNTLYNFSKKNLETLFYASSAFRFFLENALFKQNQSEIFPQLFEQQLSPPASIFVENVNSFDVNTPNQIVVDQNDQSFLNYGGDLNQQQIGNSESEIPNLRVTQSNKITKQPECENSEKQKLITKSEIQSQTEENNDDFTFQEDLKACIKYLQKVILTYKNKATTRKQ